MKNTLLIMGTCSQIDQNALGSEWEIVCFDDPERLRRFAACQQVDLLVASISQKSASLVTLINEICSLHQLNGLVFCTPERMDSLCYQFRNAPIMILPSRISAHVVCRVIDFMAKKARSERQMAQSLLKEKRRVQDEKLVSQAKVQLVSLCRWSEQKAHQYIQKTAMDHSMSKAAAARQILAKLERMVNENEKNKCDATA